MLVPNAARQCGKYTPSPYSNPPSSLKIAIGANRRRTQNLLSLKTLNIPRDSPSSAICEQGREHRPQTDDNDNNLLNKDDNNRRSRGGYEREGGIL